MKAQGGKGHRAKHSQTKKHHAPPHQKHKHHPKKPAPSPAQHHTHHQKVHTAAKGAKGHKPVGLALAEMAPCCAAEALAASLRLTGQPVSDADVWALHQAAGGDYDRAVPIVAALEAAAAVGLAGVRPVSFAPVDLDDPAAAVLGVDLPGAHAVCAAGGHWSSWGGWWPLAAFPDAAAWEAWEVQWL